MKIYSVILLYLSMLVTAFWPYAGECLTLAGTIIRNQAVIEFKSMDGESFEASSNEVLMIVLPVYGIEILPDGDQVTPGQTLQGAASREMVFPYTLTFTGNVQDTATIVPTFDHANSTFLPKTTSGITGFAVYNDMDSNGVVDPQDVMVSQWLDMDADGELDSPGEVTSYGLGMSYNPDESANLLVVFNVPGTAADGNVAYFGIDGESVGDNLKTDIGNVSEATIVDDAVMKIRKEADVEEVNTGGTVTYTITAENVGTDTALQRDYDVDAGVGNYSGVLLYDILPIDVDTGNPVAIAGAPVPNGSDTENNIGIIIYSATAPAGDPTGWAWVTVEPVGVKVIGYITSDGATDYDIGITRTMTMTFGVIAPATEQIISNNSYVEFEDNSTARQNVKSNTVFTQVNILAGPGVDIRDTDFEGTPPPLTPPNDGGGTNDSQTITNARAGTAVYFTNRVENTGNIDDYYNITLAGVPVDWTAVILKSDGITPLLDTSYDGIPDTGMMAPGETQDIVIRVEIPADEALGVVTSIVPTATSSHNAAVTDQTTDRINNVIAASLDLTNHDPIPNGLEDGVITKLGDAGGYVDFPLIVRNTAAADGQYDTYMMDTPTLPADWSVVYYKDLNNDGDLDDDEKLPTLETDATAPGSWDYLIARVFIPEDANYDQNFPATPGVQDPYDIVFRATSTNNGGQDSITDQVLVNPNNIFELRPDRSGMIEPGGVVYYTHELQNYGSRANRFYLEIAPGTADWAYILYEEDLSAPLPLEPAAVPYQGYPYIDLDGAGGAIDSKKLAIKIFAPTHAPVWSVDVTTITALEDTFGTGHTSTVIDTTRVISGDLMLTKTSNPLPGVPVAPGDTIDYTTEFFNKGTEPLTNVIIYDAIPSYTDYDLGSQAFAGPLADGITGATFEVSRDGGITWVADVAGVVDPTVTNIRARLTGSLNPGAKGSVTFTIQVE